MGNLDSHDALCRALANAVPCIVVNVDYRCSVRAARLLLAVYPNNATLPSWKIACTALT